MADLDMCSGEQCPLAEACYRHTAPPSKHSQAYFGEPPYDHKYEVCPHFIPNNSQNKP